MKIDNDKYFKERSGGQAVLDVLSGILLGFSSGLKGGPNAGVEMMNAKIDRSIMSQKQEIEAKKGRVADMKGLLADAFRITGNMDQAEALARGSIYKGLEEKALEMTAGAKSKQIQANTDYAVADLRKKGAEEETRFYKYVPAGVAGGGLPKKAEENVFVGADGRRYAARNADSRKVLAGASTTYQELQGALSDYKNALQRIDKVDKGLGKVSWNTKAMSDAESAYNRALSIERKAQHDGVWKPSEKEMLANTLTPPTDFSGDAVGQAALADKAAARTYMQTMKIEDPLPVDTEQRGYGSAPTAVPTGGNYAPTRPEGSGAQPVPKDLIK